VSGIIFVIRNGLRWRDAPASYGPHKTIYNRFIRWSRLGVFNRIFAELAAKCSAPFKMRTRVASSRNVPERSVVASRKMLPTGP
jgi:transposase